MSDKKTDEAFDPPTPKLSELSFLPDIELLKASLSII